MQNIYTRQYVRKKQRIIGDSRHLSHGQLSLLPCGRWYHIIRSCTSFFSQTSLSSTMDFLCPLSTKRRKTSSSPWLSDVLHNNRRELRSAERKWKKSQLDTDLISYCTLLSKFSLDVTSAKTSFYKEKLETSAQDPQKLHNIFSSLLNPPAPPAPSSLTAKDFATFYTEKIEKIRQTFTSASTSSTSHSHHSVTPSLKRLSTVAAEEVLQIIRSCNPTTCPLDPIPSTMLQTISPDLLPFITTVINGSLASDHVPTAFKKARVIPILKKPALDLSDISNYRPISQTVILLNLSAAFDTVNHKTLLSTPRSLGICGTAWEWFASYLDGRHIRYHGFCSDLSVSSGHFILDDGSSAETQSPFSHCSQPWVHNIIQRFRESGTISVRKGQGRKTILDARDLRALRRHCITYRNATVMEITTWAQEYFQKTLSVNTIHRAIRRCRLKLYRSKKKPYLNMIQKRRRFLWAKAHLKWTVAKWKTVLWSDESKFEVLFGKLGRHVIRTKEDKDNPSCYQRSVQKPASLMVLGCMSACGMGSLHIWKGTINAERMETIGKLLWFRGMKHYVSVDIDAEWIRIKNLFTQQSFSVGLLKLRKLSGRKKCGRKRCTTNRENRSLMRIVKQNPFKNLSELHKEWTEAGVKASRSTTHRRVKEFGYSCRIPLVKPLLNHRQRQTRLTWAKEKKNWTVAQWSKVLFSDESKFCISFGNQGPRVWRKGGEAHSPSCLKSSVKFPQSVMIWGAMSSAGVGPLCFLKTKVTAPVYQEILEHFMLPSADQLFEDADFIFQQDLAPAHTAKSTKSWLNDHGVGVLDWPANSPDLNPIENLWGIVKRKMRNKSPKNADELKATVKETWASIPPQQCHKLITSMPRPIEAVFKAKGAPTKY
ncbi:hypothetical protein QTP86_008210 [Hemibagrus guttatus]|nr:hypothetical protein QTP86_008210 [Hemibagrus guttatus]